MGYAGRVAALAVITVLAACGGQAPTPVARVSPTGTSQASPSSSPSPVSPLGVCDATHRCLAVVTLRGSDQLVVRDVTDIDHPSTVSTISSGVPQFVSASELSYSDAVGVYTMPLAGSGPTLVARASNGMGLFAWSPDGTELAYLSTDGVHVLTNGRDTTFGGALKQPAGGYGCESQVCGDTWDSRLTFSPDDAYVSLLVNSGPVTGFHIWTPGGGSVTTPASQAPTMSVWSGRSLYFRDSGGVEVWRDGATSHFLPGVQWVRPKGSPAGGQIVYEARDGSGLAHVYVVDTLSAKVTELKAGRREPVFLTSRYVWYAGERLCVAADKCAIGSTTPTGKTYIYDLQTGTEYESIITNVYDVWPHAA